MSKVYLKIAVYALGVGVFMSLGWAITQKAFGETKASDYLPEGTVFFMEKNVGNVYQNAVFDVDLSFLFQEEELIAVALIENPSTLGLEEVLVYDASEVGERKEGFVKKDLLFVTDNESFGDWLRGYDGEVLGKSRKFQSVMKRVPKGVAAMYVDYENMGDSFFQEFRVLSENGLSRKAVDPLIGNFLAEGMVLFSNGEGVYVQSYLLLKESVESTNKSYVPYLDGIVSEKASVFFGGSDLENLLSKYIAVVVGDSSSKKDLYDVLLQREVEKYFGADVNFVQDVLGIFDGEFAFSVEEGAYKMAFVLAGSEYEENVDVLVENLAFNTGAFEPRTVLRELPDGSVMREVVAVSDRVEFGSYNFQGFEIRVVKLGDEKKIAYTVMEDVFVLSSSEGVVEDSVRLFLGEGKSLRGMKSYEDTKRHALNYADELFFVNLESKEFEQVESLKKYMIGWGAVYNAREVRDNGVMTLNYIYR